jgi:DNA-binding transcriptional LysR family regulator
LLRINTSVPLGLHRLLPLLPDFAKRYPDIKVEVVLTDLVVDLLEERADVAIRVGPMRESRLLARKLGESRMVVVASPSYLAEHGTPKTPDDLADHNLLRFGFAKWENGWPFKIGGETIAVIPSGNALVSDGEAMQHLAVAGMGLARLARFHVEADIAAGRLVPVLEAFNPGDIEPIHAVFVGHGGQLPARVRAFLDYLVETVRL